MEEKTRVVVYSQEATKDLNNIFVYGTDAFSPFSAETFILELVTKIDELATKYLYHTECRFLPTKSRKYRMMRFFSYQVVYRIAKNRIEVLIIIHSSQSKNTIRKARSIKIQ